MRESAGSVMLYNVIIVFIVIIFAFLAAIICYYRAYKVNSSIVVILEKYEGYTEEAKQEIDKITDNIGYYVENGVKCPNRKDGSELVNDGTKGYCIYYYEKDNSNYYDSYGALTYISWNFPLLNDLIKLPIYAKTDNIYRFNGA